MFDLWFKGWRRQKLSKKKAPAHWPQILEHSFWYWEFISPPQRYRLLQLMQIFIHEKEIVVPKEVKHPEQAKVTVAAAACLMLLGFEDLYCFDRVRTVILQSQSFRQKVRSNSPHIVSEVQAAGVRPGPGAHGGLSVPGGRAPHPLPVCNVRVRVVSQCVCTSQLCSLVPLRTCCQWW